MGQRHHVSADGPWLSVPGRHPRRRQPQGAGVPALKHADPADFCVAALQEALAKFGGPEIFNTDQGAQFTSDEWIKVLQDAGVAISTDGKARWIDNVFIERLWRSVKYEEVYLHAYTNGTEARTALTRYFSFYNAHRSHRALEYQTPDEV
jgi:putative transposase